MTAETETETTTRDLSPRISRRALLVGGSSIVVLAAIGVRLATSNNSSSDGQTPANAAGPQPAPAAVPAGDRVAQIQALGARYRALSSTDTSATALQQLPPMTDAADVEAALHRDRDIIRQQYKEGDVVVIDGWRIARREAQLAAQASQL